MSGYSSKHSKITTSLMKSAKRERKYRKRLDTILNFYKKLIQLRKELPVIANGTIYSDGKVDGTLRPYECKVMRSI